MCTNAGREFYAIEREMAIGNKPRAHFLSPRSTSDEVFLPRGLFSNAESAENFAQQIIGGEFAGDSRQRELSQA